MGFLKWLFGSKGETHTVEQTPRSLLHAINDQIAAEKKLQAERDAITNQMKERGKTFGTALRDTHRYLTDEDKAAAEYRQTTAQRLNNAVLARQIKEKQAKQGGGGGKESQG